MSYDKNKIIMKYIGSNNRFAKELLPIILKDRTSEQWYVEPMVGGANMIDKVDGNRLGSDFNEYLADMWLALTGGWTPKRAERLRRGLTGSRASFFRSCFNTGEVRYGAS